MIEAKVDIRKLQLLNDRIALAIEALNQVRLSVHGGAQLQQQPYAYGLGHTVIPQVQPFAAPSVAPMQQLAAFSPFQGLQHATLPSVPVTTWPQVTSLEIAEQLRAADPNRLAQTFPYFFSPVSPYAL